MVNWSLQPEVEDVQTGLEPTPETESPTTEETPNQFAEIERRIAAIEEANKRAEEIANDLRRSVGRVQSLTDKVEKATGETRAALTRQLEERYSELTNLVGETVGSLDSAVLPDSVKQKLIEAQTTARTRTAAEEIQRAIDEKFKEMVPTPAPQESQSVPPEWLSLERDIEKMLTDANLDVQKDFDWNYAAYMLRAGRTTSEVKAYAESTIDRSAPGAKIQEKKEAAGPGSPSGEAGTPKSDWDKLSDRNITTAEKIKIMQKLKLI